MSGDTTRAVLAPTVGRVLYGHRALDTLAIELGTHRGAARAVVVSNRSLLRQREVVDLVSERAGAPITLAPPVRAHVPSTDVDALIDCIEGCHATVVLAVGGSSVSDAAKLARARVGSRGVRPVQLIAVPTTLSGGEFLASAGYLAGGEPSKSVVRDAALLPDLVVLDPRATLATPPELWASTGVKAVDHACETVWAPRRNAHSMALATAALSGLYANLPRMSGDHTDLAPRLECQVAAWVAAAGLAGVGGYLSHAIAHGLGAVTGLAHGLTSCATLGAVMSHVAATAPDRLEPIELASGLSGRAPIGVRHAAWLERIGLAPVELPSPWRSEQVFDDVLEHTRDELRTRGYDEVAASDWLRVLVARIWVDLRGDTPA